MLRGEEGDTPAHTRSLLQPKLGPEAQPVAALQAACPPIRPHIPQFRENISVEKLTDGDTRSPPTLSPGPTTSLFLEGTCLLPGSPLTTTWTSSPWWDERRSESHKQMSRYQSCSWSSGRGPEPLPILTVGSRVIRPGGPAGPSGGMEPPPRLSGPEDTQLMSDLPVREQTGFP